MATGGVLLLAAGASRRFGSDKRRHLLADGTPLLQASLACYTAVFPSIVVVLRPDDDGLAAESAGRGGVSVVRCPQAHLGMGHSLACGARAAPPGWDYLFVALADMAWVREDTLVRLNAALAGRVLRDRDAIVQPAYRGTPGHPVGFGAAWVARLTTLEGDVGARPLLTSAGARVERIGVDDPGVLEDLDRPPG